MSHKSSSIIKPLVYRMRDACTALRCSPSTVARMEKAGKLNPVRLGAGKGTKAYPADQIHRLAGLSSD